jgi:hypothetical protein
VRNARVWRALLGVEKTIVEGVEFDEAMQVLVARVRLLTVALDDDVVVGARRWGCRS